MAPSSPLLRPITRADDPAMAEVIRTVMPSFGASGAGFAIQDPEVDHLSIAYSQPRHTYFVVEEDGRVKGGGGVGPLANAAEDVCELRKMYFLPELRGRGLGEQVLRKCLEEARRFGFRTCYLETLTGMAEAQKLYVKLGFQRLDKPMGNTGHFGCDRWYALELRG